MAFRIDLEDTTIDDHYFSNPLWGLYPICDLKARSGIGWWGGDLEPEGDHGVLAALFDQYLIHPVLSVMGNLHYLQPAIQIEGSRIHLHQLQTMTSPHLQLHPHCPTHLDVLEKVVVNT